MRLRSLRLRPFAGVADNTIQFNAGLNVIVGPNEAGKSTLISALHCALFQGVDPGARTWKSLERYLPLPLGDHFRVILELVIEGQDYSLTKTWSASKRIRSCELRMPRGQVLADPTEVNALLASLVGWKYGTWRNVICADQTALPRTLDSIKQDRETRNDVTQRLRKAVLETDGVSLERLETQLQEELRHCHAHWDVALGRPEGNRDIQNPWSRDVGTVLDAFYSMRKAELAWEKALRFEQERDACLSRKSTLIAERDECEAFRQKWEPLLNQANKRNELESLRTAKQQDCDNLQIAFRNWPAYSEEVERLKTSLEEKGSAFQTLESELTRATEWTKLAPKRYQLETVLKLQDQVKQKSEALQGIKRITAEQVRTLEDAVRRKQTFETKLSAGKLRLTLETVRNTTIVHQSDLGSRTEQTLISDVPLHLEAGGRILLEHPDWKLIVESGDSSFDELRSAYQAVEEEIQCVLADADIGTIEDFRSFGLKYAEAEKAVIECRRDLAKALNGTTIEDLVQAVGTPHDGSLLRDISQITNEKLALGKDIQELDTRLKNLDLQLSAWSRDYQTVDQVLNLLAPLHLRIGELTEEINALPVATDSVPNLDRVQAEFQRTESRLRVIKETELPETREQLARLQGDEPDSSVAELVEQLATERLAFEEAQKRAQAFQTILSVFTDLKTSLDQNPLDPLLEDVQHLLHELTGDRFDQIKLAEGTFRRRGSVTMPADLLSVGMNAGFGLVVRLAMASHFLSGQDGLLVLDDPFVDIDPVRQKAAAELISAFAQDKQVLVLTCHPSQAALFGVSPIELGRLN